MTDNTLSPILSVIVCAYNEEKRIEECLNSLINQKNCKNEYEILIVDDESTDQTPRIVKDIICRRKSLPPKIHYLKQIHKGLSGARNTGVQNAKGEFLAFIDGDAIAAPNWAKTIIETFKTDSQTKVIGGSIENLNNESNVARFLHKAHYQANMILFESQIIGTNMAFSRDVFSTLAFYSLFQRRGDETSLLFDIIHFNPNWKIVAEPKIIVYHEHLTSIVQWIKQRCFSGYLTGLIEIAIVKGLSPLKIGKRFCIRALNVLSLPIFFLLGLIPIDTPIKLSLYITLFILWFFRQIVLIPVLKNAFHLTKLEFSLSIAFSAIFLRISGQMVQDLGYCFGILKTILNKNINIDRTGGNVVEIETNS